MLQYKITFQTGVKHRIHTDEKPEILVVTPQGRESARKAFKRAYKSLPNAIKGARITKIEEIAQN